MSQRYKQQTAATCMVENVPTVAPKATIGEIINVLARYASSYSSIGYVYLVGPDRTLVGVVSIKEIFTHSHHTIAAAVAKPTLYSVGSTTSAEEVALFAINHNLKAVPVVDESTNKLLGVVTPDIIRDILHYGRIHDSLIHAGAQSFDDPHESLLTGTPLLHIRKRLPWLLLGLAGGFLAAYIVRLFETTLVSHVLLVAFIPLVVYLADAVGSQTEIIFVRALALDPNLRRFQRFRRYAWRETIVTLTLSTVLAILMAGVTTWWFEAPELVGIMIAAVMSTLFLAMLVAIIVPYLAVRLRFDPALTSGPVATVIRDVMTLVVYVSIIALFI